MSELEELAKQGRDQRPAPKPIRPDKANLSTPEHAMLKLSPLYGLARVAWWTAWTVGCIAVFLIITCSVSLKYPGPGAHPERQIIIGCVVALAVTIPLAFVARRRAMTRGREVYAAEQAWVTAQPFTVVGYFETVGRHNWVSDAGSASLTVGNPGTAARHYRVRVTLGFGFKKPDDQILRDALDGFGAPLSGNEQSGNHFTFNGRYDPEQTTQRVLHQLVPAIHADYPLLTVQFEAEKR